MTDTERLAALLHEVGTCWNEEFGCGGPEDHMTDADRLIAAGVGFPVEAVAAERERIRREVEVLPDPRHEGYAPDDHIRRAAVLAIVLGDEP